MFSAEATGTEPLSYKWEWSPAGERRGTEEWQPCDLESFPGGDSSTVTIPSVQKSNEGSYRCVISNCAGSKTSNPAELSIGKNSALMLECGKVHVTPILSPCM